MDVLLTLSCVTVTVEQVSCVDGFENRNPTSSKTDWRYVDPSTVNAKRGLEQRSERSNSHTVTHRYWEQNLSRCNDWNNTF